MIRYFGYVDLRNDGNIRTCGLAEFDTKELSETDKLALEGYYGDDSFDNTVLLESVVPTKIYFLIDNQDMAYNKRFITHEDKINNHTYWPVEVRDVFKSYGKAKKVLYEQKSLIFRNIFK